VIYKNGVCAHLPLVLDSRINQVQHGVAVSARFQLFQEHAAEPKTICTVEIRVHNRGKMIVQGINLEE
jgi:hypothetical protein